MKLDLSSLELAISKLHECLQEAQSAASEKHRELFRMASIQAFEYTYELTHKSLKRYLENTEPSSASIDQMPFPDMIRLASERGLTLNGWDAWLRFRNARNATSHSYKAEKALEVYGVIPDFLKEAEFVYAAINKS